MTTLRDLLAPYSKAISAFAGAFVLLVLVAAFDGDGLALPEVGSAVGTAALTALGVYVAPKNRRRPEPPRCTCPVGTGWTPGYSASCPVHGTNSGTGGSRLRRPRRRR